MRTTSKTGPQVPRRRAATSLRRTLLTDINIDHVLVKFATKRTIMFYVGRAASVDSKNEIETTSMRRQKIPKRESSSFQMRRTRARNMWMM